MRRIHIPSSLQHRYQVYKPRGRHRACRIAKIQADGSQSTIKDERIEAVNRQLIDGGLSLEQAVTQMQLIVEDLYRRDGVKISRVESNRENEAIVERYYKEIVARRKTLADSKSSAKAAAYRAVRALGEHSLLSAPIDVLQDALDAKYPESDRRQPKLARRLNSVLKFVGREERIQAYAEQEPEVKFIPFEAMTQILPRLPNEPFRVLCQMALYTGLRIGELMALEPRHLKRDAGAIYVEWQINKAGERTKPKWGKRRIAAVFAEALDLFDRWIEVKDQVGHKTRLRAARLVLSASRRAYPRKSEHHICFHDLRHSYAIKCFEQGMSLEWVAKQLGNRIEVTEKHYVGFVQTLNTVEAAFKLMNKGRKGRVA